MSDLNAQPVWEQRWHPLRGEWVLFTSHRGGRPWIGETHRPSAKEVPVYDPECALCPGNQRLKGKNPEYQGVYGFTNDLPCFSPEAPEVDGGDDLYAIRAARGTAEVVCYHPDHSKTMADLSVSQVSDVVAHWRSRYAELGSRPGIDHVLIFENKGELVGTSNPHPHCQIYAGNMIYGHTAAEVRMARQWHEKTGALLGQEIVRREEQSVRVVCRNDDFIACVPWFARYAYEVLILPRAPASSLLDLNESRVANLAAILREVTIRYDNLWEMPFPYVMAIHQAPTDGGDYPYYPFHFEFHPPLRKPDTQKYLAGPEIGGGSMTNESNPDAKAAELRAVSSKLYRQNSSE
ncbi:MAG: galactose-1-phosphate uridylyltransferase [Opitutales bacterium]|nr:galactose-1-phosphate uridylyltransferase [Opitutales bacterium]MCH8541045.1 galactose-1-phosphate uridylyltransferase [Opitutales bacterium]